MDPLSIAASIITISELGEKLWKIFQQLRRAPDEVLALINEISEWRLMTGELEDVLNERNREDLLPLQVTISVSRILVQAKENLHELDSLVHQRLLNHAGNLKFKRVRWLRVRPEVERIRKTLNLTRSELSTVLAVAHLSDNNRIVLRLEEVKLIGRELTAQRQAPPEIIDQLAEHGRLLHALLEHFQSPVSGVPPCDMELPSIELTALQSNINKEASTIDTMVTTAQDLTSYFSSLDVQSTRYRKVRCQIWCSCTCHKRVRISDPSSFPVRFIRELFSGYTSSVSSIPQGNERECRRRPVWSPLVTHRFSVSYLLHALFRSLLPDISPSRGLIMKRIVKKEAIFFEHVCSGRIGDIQFMFSRRLASPFDVDSETHFSALHWAVLHHQVDVCRVLLEQGADPSFEDVTGSTAMDELWQFFWESEPKISKRLDYVPYQTRQQLLQLFGTSLLESSDRLALSTLQKAVLGIVDLDVEVLLAASTSSIDDTDSKGRTALMWAALRADIQIVQILLGSGANVHRQASNGESALHWAVKANSAECVKILLEHGASAAVYDAFGRTVLHFAAKCCDTEVVDLLLRHGADANAQDHFEDPPLYHALRRNSVEIVALLLDCNADINHISQGWPLLIYCVYWNCRESVQLLLNRGANYSQPTEDGMTIFHVAASWGTPDMIKCLSGAALPGLDIDALDATGLSAEKRLLERNTQDRDILDNFQALIHSVRQERSTKPDKEIDKTECKTSVLEARITLIRSQLGSWCVALVLAFAFFHTLYIVVCNPFLNNLSWLLNWLHVSFSRSIPLVDAVY